MNRTVAIVVLICLARSAVLAAGPASQPAANPKLAAMTPHSWLQIGPPPPTSKGIMAYSGGTFDSVHNVILIFGGGHGDYWGNEVCAFDVATLAWKKMYEPDAQARYTNDNIDNTNGKLKDSDKPYTRHSYQMLVFVPSVKKMFIWSGCGPGWGKISPTCPAPKDAWYYDYAANKWAPAVTGGPKGFGGGTCYDSKRDVVWALEGESWPPLWQFDVKTGKWIKHPLKPDSAAGAHLNLAYNAKRDVILAGVTEGKLSYLINPETFTVEKVDTSAYRPHGSGGLTMLPDHDVAISLTEDPTLGVFDFAAKRWARLDGPAGGPKMLGYGVYGRLWWSPIDKVVLFVGPAGTWAYKPPVKFELPPASQPAGASRQVPSTTQPSALISHSPDGNLCVSQAGDTQGRLGEVRVSSLKGGAADVPLPLSPQAKTWNVRDVRTSFVWSKDSLAVAVRISSGPEDEVYICVGFPDGAFKAWRITGLPKMIAVEKPPKDFIRWEHIPGDWSEPQQSDQRYWRCFWITTHCWDDRGQRYTEKQIYAVYENGWGTN